MDGSGHEEHGALSALASSLLVLPCRCPLVNVFGFPESAMSFRAVVALLAILSLTASPAAAQPAASEPSKKKAAKPAPLTKEQQRLALLKKEAAADVDRQATLTQQMVDSVFSFGELGFQETESSRYLTGILEQHGFRITLGISSIPTAWIAEWGSGKPVIALGSDIDGIPQASQKPGVAYRDPIVDGAPGHGEGHNSGIPLNVTAALAVKKIMEREKLPGTLRLWPGVAEELVGSKAWFVRDGAFKDVDISFFAHVDNKFGPSWGVRQGTGLVSIEYTFTGQTAHSAGAPWRGKSALDAVELMNIGGTTGASISGFSIARTTSSPTAAISPTSSLASPASGTTSARPSTRESRNCGTSAAPSPTAPRR